MSHSPHYARSQNNTDETPLSIKTKVNNKTRISKLKTNIEVLWRAYNKGTNQSGIKQNYTTIKYYVTASIFLQLDLSPPYKKANQQLFFPLFRTVFKLQHCISMRERERKRDSKKEE